MVAEREAPRRPKRKPPRHRMSRRPRSEVCPNCGHSIAINYCPNCGQHASDHNSSIWGFVVEFFDDFLQIDSKFLRTIGALVRKPGFLTQEWCRGKRASYISPLKLYIAVNALFFLAMAFKIPADQLAGTTINIGAPSAAQQKLVEDRAKKSGSWFDRKMSDVFSNKTDPEAIRREFTDHLSTMSLVLIPFATFIFSLLYFRRSRFYLEHLVFLLHVNSFCFVTLGVAMFVPWPWALPLVFFWHFVYVYAAMKRNYEQGWIKTFVKLCLFGAAYFFLVLMGIVITAFAATLMASERKPPAVSSTANQPGTGTSTTNKPPLPGAAVTPPKQPAVNP